VKTSDPSSVHVGGLVLRGRRLVVLNKVRRRRRHRRSVSTAVVIIHDVDHEVRLHYRVIAVVVIVIVAYTIHRRQLIVVDMVRERNLLLNVHQNHVSVDNKKMRSDLLVMILLYRAYNHSRVEPYLNTSQPSLPS
jgi:hypothetical protein